MNTANTPTSQISPAHQLIRARLPAMSTPEVYDLTKTEADAERSLIAYRWPYGPICPVTGCGSRDIRECRGYKRANELPVNYVCRACRRRFTVRTGYFLSESSLSFRTWFWALYLVLTATELDPITQTSLVRLLGVAWASAPSIIQRIRAHTRDPAKWTGVPDDRANQPTRQTPRPPYVTSNDGPDEPSHREPSPQ